jgi:3-carboxy-cis,cis-muconate cycloisomerase
MLLVLGALAKVQGELGVIPETSARAIHRASMELQLDPAGLADGVAQSAVPVPALVGLFKSAMQAPEHARFVHWGATSQDILDSAIALRLRQALSLIEGHVTSTLAGLADLAGAEAEQVMLARTYGQAAVPTTFGAVVAAWGRPILGLKDELDAVRTGVLKVQLGGAAGTLSALERGPEVRAALAENLGLRDPGASWHTDRSGMARLAGWSSALAMSLGKIGADLIDLSSTALGEVSLRSAGASSTMPQKANPVAPSTLLALSNHVAAMGSALLSSGVQRGQRDGAAWMGEWLSLPAMIISTGQAAALASRVVAGIGVHPERMKTNLIAAGPGIMSECAVFHLAQDMPRDAAVARVKDVLAEAEDIASFEMALELPQGSLRPGAHTGTAVADARAFARAVQG